MRAEGRAVFVTRHNAQPMQLQRIAWIVTVGACLITSLLCFLSNYEGYAGVFLAVGASAAINVV
jgi:hypothetical protein